MECFDLTKLDEPDHGVIGDPVAVEVGRANFESAATCTRAVRAARARLGVPHGATVVGRAQMEPYIHPDSHAPSVASPPDARPVEALSHLGHLAAAS